MHRAGRSLARRSNAALQRRRLHTASPVQITTLPNKIRVATDTTPGHFSSVGLYVDAGSRYETPETSGASHFIDRLAFKSTLSRSDSDMFTAMHSIGGQIMCSSSRETIMYQSSHAHQYTPLAMSLISDTVLNPAFLEEEIYDQRDAASYEIRELSSKPEMILPEIVHQVAYGHKGLGNPLLCPEDRISSLTSKVLHRYRKEWYRPERMVVAGAGMPHDQLVELTDKYFASLKPSTSQSFAPRPAYQPPPNILSQTNTTLPRSLTRAASYLFPNSLHNDSHPNNPSAYTGGHQFIFDGASEFNHLYVAYEGVGIHDDDIYALATMQILLGGGGSFSAGGPGKGMYTRLYTHILNHFPQIDHCASFHHIYTDSSLFGLFASFVPSVGGRHGNTPSQILPYLAHQLSLLMYKATPAQELQRAKNQLKSSMMMAMESRALTVEDLGRQILVHDRRVPISEMTEKIDQVSAADIQRVANRLFGPSSGNRPTTVVRGHEDIVDWRDTFRQYGLASL